MWSQRRIAPVALASMTLATGCFSVDRVNAAREHDDDTATAAADTDTDDTSGVTSPISTVTSDTGVGTTGDASTGGGTSDSGDSGTSGTTGDPIDLPPTIEVKVNDSINPPTIVQASTQIISALVDDDGAVVRVEFFLDDDVIPFAVREGAPWSVSLPIYDNEFNALHAVHAIAYDDAEPDSQATASDEVAFKVELPFGGSKIWQAGSESKFASKANGVIVDSAGDVIVVGYQAVSVDLLRTRMMIRKYEGSTGALLWQREVPSQMEVPSPAGNNVARGVAVDSSDNVYVTGQIDPKGQATSLWLGKFTSDGLPIGAHVGSDPESRGYAVAIDADDRIFAVGFNTKANLNPMGTISALDQNLKPLWGTELTAAGATGNWVYTLAIDHNGDIVVGGALPIDQKRWRGLVALYSPTGAMKWWKGTNALDEPQEAIYSVAVTAENEYVCVGRRKVSADKRRLWVLHVDASGDESTSETDPFGRCGGRTDDNEDFCGVAIDPAGHYILAGVAPEGPANDDFLVKKTKMGLLMDMWSAVIDGYDGADDRSVEVTVDHDGFVIAVGFETHLGVPRWLVTKLNP